MAYTKTVWADGPVGGTPVNSTRLQNIEDGVEQLDTDVTALLAQPTGLTWSIKTFANSGEEVVADDGLFVDTSGGATTLDLPASASLGDTIKFVDLGGNFATNNLTIGANGLNIMGGAVDLNLIADHDYVELVYTDATNGWVITAKP